jgi:large subunit ribosomal protein L31e
MADEKTKTDKKQESKLEREYIIPLRKEWLKVPMYERSGRAVKAIKKFIAKHMKVTDRDVKKVKLDIYFNNDIWFKGRTNPPAKIKVKAIKEGEIVRVEYAEVPEYVKFLKAKHEKAKQRLETKSKAAQPEVEPAESKAPEAEKTTEQQTSEKEKEKSVADAGIKQADMKAREQKHITKSEKAQRPVRMALKK